jgi:hypothetical protein
VIGKPYTTSVILRQDALQQRFSLYQWTSNEVKSVKVQQIESVKYSSGLSTFDLSKMSLALARCRNQWSSGESATVNVTFAIDLGAVLGPTSQ